MVVKWTVGDGGTAGSESSRTRGRLAVGEQQMGTGDGLGGDGEREGQRRAAGQNWERGEGMPLAATSTWDRVRQEGRTVGHAGDPSQHILGLNLRPK
jgi:hypothetical protein